MSKCFLASPLLSPLYFRHQRLSSTERTKKKTRTQSIHFRSMKFYFTIKNGSKWRRFSHKKKNLWRRNLQAKNTSQWHESDEKFPFRRLLAAIKTQNLSKISLAWNANSIETIWPDFTLTFSLWINVNKAKLTPREKTICSFCWTQRFWHRPLENSRNHNLCSLAAIEREKSK